MDYGSIAVISKELTDLFTMIVHCDDEDTEIRVKLKSQIDQQISQLREILK